MWRGSGGSVDTSGAAASGAALDTGVALDAVVAAETLGEGEGAVALGVVCGSGPALEGVERQATSKRRAARRIVYNPLPNSMSTGVGVCTVSPVGASLPVDASTRKTTMVSEFWLAT